MKRSVVIVVLGLFFVVPLAYFIFVYTHEVTEESVKGVTTHEQVEPELGISLEVSSKTGTWDLYEYLCDTKETCVDSLMSGKRLGTVGGGEVEGYKIKLVPDNTWEGSSYLKVFIKSGWGSPAGTFDITDVGEVPETEIFDITYEGVTYGVLVMPTEEISKGFYNSASFSDY